MMLRELRDGGELEMAFKIIRDARPALSYPEFLELYEAARAADGFRLVGGFTDEQCVAVMGCRVLHDFVHGRHLYIDDLVVAPDSRSHGLGAEMLRHAERLAVELECRSLRLSTGVANAGARHFYEKEGWEARSVVYKKRVPSLDALEGAHGLA